MGGFSNSSFAARMMAFIDLGDQFIALQKAGKQQTDAGRHFGLVVDDKEAARRALHDAA
jgi:lactoylglutathione lyase